MSKRTIEIRAAEGGEDARLFAAELANAYLRMAKRLGWRAQADRKPDTRSGNQTLSLEVEGRGVEALDTETGGHRVQRVPRSERNGRVHSSTVTVAVLVAQDTANTSDSAWTRRAPGDFSLEWRSGTGCGGQHRNNIAPVCDTYVAESYAYGRYPYPSTSSNYGMDRVPVACAMSGVAPDV